MLDYTEENADHAIEKDTLAGAWTYKFQPLDKHGWSYLTFFFWLSFSNAMYE